MSSATSVRRRPATVQSTAEDLRLEIALLLFEREHLTLGQAARLAGASQAAFMRILGDRRISLHYDVAEFKSDLRTLDAARRNKG
jgi:predicted HTH domain antitoxin